MYKKIRLKKNILQKHIASHLQISENAYSRIENGHTQITIEYLYQIAEALDCEIEEILNIKNGNVLNYNSNLVITQINESSFNITLNQNDFLFIRELLESKKKV